MQFHFVSVYRPLNSNQNIFLDEFHNYSSNKSFNCENTFEVGDFNIHIDNKNNSFAKSFIQLLASFNISQRMRMHTHEKGHITLL